MYTKPEHLRTAKCANCGEIAYRFPKGVRLWAHKIDTDAYTVYCNVRSNGGPTLLVAPILHPDSLLDEILNG